jgi:hypothetical protein
MTDRVTAGARGQCPIRRRVRRRAQNDQQLSRPSGRGQPSRGQPGPMPPATPRPGHLASPRTGPPRRLRARPQTTGSARAPPGGRLRRARLRHPGRSSAPSSAWSPSVVLRRPPRPPRPLRRHTLLRRLRRHTPPRRHSPTRRPVRPSPPRLHTEPRRLRLYGLICRLGQHTPTSRPGRPSPPRRPGRPSLIRLARPARLIGRFPAKRPSGGSLSLLRQVWV